MKKVWFFVILSLMFCSISYGLDRKFDTTNTFEIRLIGASGVPFTNSPYVTFGNLVFYVQCHDVYGITEIKVTVDEVGDTLDTTDIGRGIIRLTTNDTMPTCTECICTFYAEGQANTDLAGLIDSSSGIEFKAVETVLGDIFVTGTISAGSTSTSLISTAFSASEASDYQGWIICVNYENCSIVKTFNPATDNIVTMSSVGTVSTGMVVQLHSAGDMDEILQRIRTYP